MQIHRSGPCPPFFEYVCQTALIPANAPPTSSLIGLGVIQWVDVPRYQRGISWDLDNIKEFLESSSILLGNVILAHFPHPPGRFPHLPTNVGNHLVLVDGLQRLSVGTAILAALHHRVLSPTPSLAGPSSLFGPAKARIAPLSPAYLHNHDQLSNHPRRAIRQQYTTLAESVDRYVDEQLNGPGASALADSVQRTFLERQVAIDIYFNFSSAVELMNTFLGINTVRVDLGPVDLLRAHIVERAATAGWTSADIDDVENEFTAVFTQDDKPDRELLPFVTAALKCIAGSQGSRLFPSWDSSLLKTEVDDLIEFCSKYQGTSGNAFLDEIRECGSLPSAMVLAHYYTRRVHAGAADPSFFAGGTSEDADLHAFLLASYRLLLNNSIGRSGPVLHEVLAGTLTKSLPDLGNQLSVDYIGRSLGNAVDGDWLSTVLGRVDKRRAKRVFNAALLPDRTLPRGSAFSPLSFGRKSTQFHVDHLIPDSLLQAGAGSAEGQTLRNFAPLPSSLNRIAKATPCSQKLSTGGIYANYLAGTTHQPHTYCQWLCSNFPPANPAQLDVQALLERNQNPAVGDDRMGWFHGALLSRL